MFDSTLMIIGNRCIPYSIFNIPDVESERAWKRNKMRQFSCAISLIKFQAEFYFFMPNFSFSFFFSFSFS
jgi:hypothetical protein